METIISMRALSLAAMEWAVKHLYISSEQDSLAELLAEGMWVAIKLCSSLNMQELNKYVSEVTGWGWMDWTLQINTFVWTEIF